MLDRLSPFLFTALVATAALPAMAQNDPPSGESSATEGTVTFFCGQTYDSASKSQIPTTLVWTSEKNGNVALIRWKSQYFDRSTGGNQKRCLTVSAKFQKLWDAGQLNLITTGTANGLPIVCGVANEGDACNSQNQLFTLKPFADQQALTAQLSGIFEGKVSSPIYESGGGDGSYINIRNLLRSKSVISRQAPQRKK
jgi:Circadian oscillating protein COP23